MADQELQEQINAAIVAHYTELDDRGNFVNPPRTNAELDEFIQAAYGIRLPSKVITPGHKTPLDFVADLFFERVSNALAFANRNGSKTFATALLNHLDMTFKKGCEIASAGAVKDQAEKCYRYFLTFLNKEWFKDLSRRYRKITGKDFFDPRNSIKSKSTFGNGSILEIVTATENGLRGPHPHKARIDEIDEIEWDTFQTGLSMSHSDDHIRGQNTFTSTRQRTNGSMQRLLDEAHEKGIHIYQWNVWEVVEKCTRRCFSDPVHGDCPIYTFCRGKAHHCDGFYKIDDFVDKVRVIDRQKFEVEWLNEKPSKEKYVYHMYAPARHVMTPEKLQQLTGFRTPQFSWRRISGLDFGSSPGHPFVYVKLTQLPVSGAWLIFYEYAAEQKLLRDHAKVIKDSPFYHAGETIFADWDAQDRLELRNLGVQTKRATKGAGTVAVGIDHISSLLSGFPPREDPLLYVWHQCTYTSFEFGCYSWPVRPDGKPDKSGVPEQVNDHAMDAIRYALFSSKKHSGPTYVARTARV